MSTDIPDSLLFIVESQTDGNYIVSDLEAANHVSKNVSQNARSHGGAQSDSLDNQQYGSSCSSDAILLYIRSKCLT